MKHKTQKGVGGGTPGGKKKPCGFSGWDLIVELLSRSQSLPFCL
jgi:hypothetical protein